MLPGGHSVENRAQGEDVRPLVHHLSLELFGGHVRRRTEDLPVRGQKIGFEKGIEADRLRLLPRNLGEAEIQDFELALVRHHDVAGLEVAVGDAALMGGAHRICDGDGEVQEPPGLETLIRDHLRQGRALDVFHGEKRDAVRFLDRVDRDDVGVVERRNSLGLAAEPFESLGIGGHFRRQDLDGHLAVELGIAGKPHLTHSALTELAKDLVVEHHPTDHTSILLQHY